MTKLGQRLIHALTEAVEGDFARVTIDGITWVRRDDARNAALEEAAKVADKMSAHWIEESPEQHVAADIIAAAIRALKDKS